ncbi:MAG: hypothetical protein SGILL_007992, partial [Bacillariaceae sp.]
KVQERIERKKQLLKETSAFMQQSELVNQEVIASNQHIRETTQRILGQTDKLQEQNDKLLEQKEFRQEKLQEMHHLSKEIDELESGATMLVPLQLDHQLAGGAPSGGDDSDDSDGESDDSDGNSHRDYHEDEDYSGREDESDDNQLDKSTEEDFSGDQSYGSEDVVSRDQPKAEDTVSDDGSKIPTDNVDAEGSSFSLIPSDQMTNVNDVSFPLESSQGIVLPVVQGSVTISLKDIIPLEEGANAHARIRLLCNNKTTYHALTEKSMLEKATKCQLFNSIMQTVGGCVPVSLLLCRKSLSQMLCLSKHHLSKYKTESMAQVYAIRSEGGIADGSDVPLMDSVLFFQANNLLPKQKYLHSGGDITNPAHVANLVDHLLKFPSDSAATAIVVNGHGTSIHRFPLEESHEYQYRWVDTAHGEEGSAVARFKTIDDLVSFFMNFALSRIKPAHCKNPFTEHHVEDAKGEEVYDARMFEACTFYGGDDLPIAQNLLIVENENSAAPSPSTGKDSDNGIPSSGSRFVPIFSNDTNSRLSIPALSTVLEQSPPTSLFSSEAVQPRALIPRARPNLVGFGDAEKLVNKDNLFFSWKLDGQQDPTSNIRKHLGIDGTPETNTVRAPPKEPSIAPEIKPFQTPSKEPSVAGLRRSTRRSKPSTKAIEAQKAEEVKKKAPKKTGGRKKKGGN